MPCKQDKDWGSFMTPINPFWSINSSSDHALWGKGERDLFLYSAIALESMDYWNWANIAIRRFAKTVWTTGNVFSLIGIIGTILTPHFGESQAPQHQKCPSTSWSQRGCCDWISYIGLQTLLHNGFFGCSQRFFVGYEHHNCPVSWWFWPNS